MDTTAAGDTLLAEWCWRRFGGLEGLGSLEVGRWAVAAGSAACTMPGGEPPDVALVGFVPRTAEEFGKTTAALKEFCDYPIISDGANGCWFDGEFVAAPEVKVLDTTAAGDTLLAEWCWSGDAWFAVAAGSAAGTMPGGEPPPVELVQELARAM